MGVGKIGWELEWKSIEEEDGIGKVGIVIQWMLRLWKGLVYDYVE